MGEPKKVGEESGKTWRDKQVNDGQCSIPRIPLRNEIISGWIWLNDYSPQICWATYNNPVAQNCGPNQGLYLESWKVHKKNGPNLWSFSSLHWYPVNILGVSTTNLLNDDWPYFLKGHGFGDCEDFSAPRRDGTRVWKGWNDRNKNGNTFPIAKTARDSRVCLIHR